MSGAEKVDLDLNPRPFFYKASQSLRCPTIFRSKSPIDETNVLTLPAPRHNMVDAIASTLNYWKPSALQKLLDLSTPRFFFGFSSSTFKEFYIERSWQHVQVGVPALVYGRGIGLSYHIHDDGLWQLLAATNTNEYDKPHCTDAKDDEFMLKSSETCVAEVLLKDFPFDPEAEKFRFRCYIITKEGRRIQIEDFDTIDSKKGTIKITCELTEIKEMLQKTLEELGASKKRKRGNDSDSE
ncbi:hypothetical protein NHQ30_003783 [Ciborinia camelliae]|nr:hypothetical protein NHQ30_003783 [Ciborinia camelliae]